MKKVRIDWNHVEGLWEPTPNALFDTTDTAVLSVMDKVHLLRCAVDVDAPDTGLAFLKEASAYGEELLLSLLGGHDTMDAYEQKVLPILKEACQCPNLTYVEINGNGIDAELYYDCYRGAYHALSKLDRPLKLGGNGVDQLLNHADSWLFFLQHLAEDTDPLKKIDFYSYSEALQDYPVRIWLMHEAHIAWLKELGLPTLPIFINGLVLTPKDQLQGVPEEALRNAATMITAVIAATEWSEFKVLLKSVYDPVPAYTQLDQDLKPTANGHAVTCLSKLSGERLVCDVIEESWPPQKDIVATKKDGTLSGDLADRDQMKLLEGYIFRYLGKLVEDIASGNVTPNPYTRGSRHNACAFCPYGSICHQATVEGRRNYKTMSAQRFWEEVEKEMKHHGG